MNFPFFNNRIRDCSINIWKGSKSFYWLNWQTFQTNSHPKQTTVFFIKLQEPRQKLIDKTSSMSSLRHKMDRENLLSTHVKRAFPDFWMNSVKNWRRYRTVAWASRNNVRWDISEWYFLVRIFEKSWLLWIFYWKKQFFIHFMLQQVLNDLI